MAVASRVDPPSCRCAEGTGHLCNLPSLGGGPCTHRRRQTAIALTPSTWATVATGAGDAFAKGSRISVAKELVADTAVSQVSSYPSHVIMLMMSLLAIMIAPSMKVITATLTRKGVANPRSSDSIRATKWLQVQNEPTGDRKRGA